MKQTSALITEARGISRNIANADGTYGIPDTEVIRYLNDGQSTMQNKISAAKNIAKIFVTEAILPVLANIEGYTIPDRVLLNKQIEYVEFSYTGLVQDYIRLQKCDYFNRDNYPTTYPNKYFKRGNQILLQPTPSTAQGTIRISYERQLDSLALMFGTTPAAMTLADTSIVVGSPVVALQPSVGDFICICDYYGNVLLRNALVTNYVAPTITIAAAVSTYMTTYGLTAGITALQSKPITVGAYTTLFSQLPDACEGYLVHYGAAEMLHKLSSSDFDTEAGILNALEKDIMDAFKAQTGEVNYIPQIAQYEYW